MAVRTSALFFLLGAVVVVGCSNDDLAEPGDPGTDLPQREGPCAAASAPKCEHGECVDDSGAALCACEKGWSGPTCADCPPGAPCATPSCAATKCGAHAACSESTGTPTCSCVVAYEIKGTECVWKGVVRDPSFEDKPTGAWTLAGGVVIDAANAGQKDPGIAELHTAMCSAARVSQSVTMPPLELGEPLAVELYGRGRCEIPLFPGPINIPCLSPVIMTVGARGFSPFLFFNANAPTSARACLGERAYGGNITFGLFPSSCSSISKTTVLDRVDIVADASCPVPGQVPNGNFEGVGGWSVGGMGAEVAPAIGNMGTRGGRLHSTKRCDASTLTGALSVRMTQPAKPALTFTVKGTNGKKLLVTSGPATLGSYTGKSVYEKVSLCIPEHLRGMAASLSFAVASDTTGGVCGDPDDVEFLFDDIAIEDDVTCEAATFVVDGGFERTDAARYWSATTDGGSVTFPRTAGANTGAGFAVVTQSTCEKSSRFSGTITVPEPNAAGGPAVEFFYKATAATAITYNAPGGALAPTATWTRAKNCLDPRRVGVATYVEFSVSAAASCATGSLSIDDIKVTHDPTCPAQ